MVNIVSQNNEYYDSCHNLSNVGGNVSFASAGDRAWHGLGTQVDQAMTSAEALELGHLANWGLEKVPYRFMDARGNHWPTGAFGVVRRDHNILLTEGKSVGDRYTIVSNEELFDFLDQVMVEIGATYETVGSLGKGETVWLLARYKGGDFTIGNADKNESFLLLQSTHDGSGSIQCYPTSVRVVCNNTLRMADRNSRGSENRYSMRHTQNVQNNIAEAIRVLGLAQKTFAQYAKQAEAMSKQAFDPDRLFQSFCDHTCSDVSIADIDVTGTTIADGSVIKAIDSTESRELRVAYERQLENVITKRDKLICNLRDRYESESCQLSAPGTLWAGLQAITEAVDHGDLLSYRGSGVAKAETRFQSLVKGKGDAWKQLALQTAVGFLAS